MSALAGFILGYVLGTKQGPESYEKLVEAWKAIVDSPEVKGLMERLPSMGDLASTGADSVFAQLRGIIDRSSGSSHADAADPTETQRPYSSGGIKVVESLFAGGMAIFGDLVERGMTMIRERQSNRE